MNVVCVCLLFCASFCVCRRVVVCFDVVCFVLCVIGVLVVCVFILCFFVCKLCCSVLFSRVDCLVFEVFMY